MLVAAVLAAFPVLGTSASADCPWCHACIRWGTTDKDKICVGEYLS